MRIRRNSDATLITRAALSRPEEIQHRQRRYVISMLFRTLCLILAVVALRGWARFAAIAIAVVLPWLAVVFANGGPPIQRDTPSLFIPRRPAGDVPPSALPRAHHVVVDGEAVDGEAVDGSVVDGSVVDGVVGGVAADGVAADGVAADRAASGR
ncbi:DUF3099 domain-containing protein [Frankia sp. Cj5]|uniref:DUF3099 domain-containing protein n=1 Tax=Frankia sp. Cj5 TaxID=2880978 RepID=UPI001EF6F56A|nr:DUF3099 domain-containing protein [Frankia sp. Cj5]